jgi:N-methylhydantoinase B/oxoprolinase/acetone carboxylase alpha subunit
MVSDGVPDQNGYIESLLILTLLGNINAPEAVTYSAIIYCLRCLISADIPLNQGCLKPINVRIPPRSLLSPSESAAVVGGNVMTVCQASIYFFLTLLANKIT